MLIREVFATKIQERIEPVVKVADRRQEVLSDELSNLVVTPQWEQYIWSVLDAYSNAATRDEEQSIGIWISGFFGSGKSLLMKVIGALLQGGELDGQTVHELFLSRIPATDSRRGEIERLLASIAHTTTTTAVGGNLHAMQASHDDPLPLICFKLFANRQDYTHYWPLAWAIEHHVDERGLTADFRRQAMERSGLEWDDLADDPEFNLDHLLLAAADVMPDQFAEGRASVERSVGAALHGGISPDMLVERLRKWCEARDAGNRRRKLMLQLDELGQWIASGNANERIMQIQALAETAAVGGAGRLWLAVTAHGDIQSLRQNVQQEQYAKINQRFDLKCTLSNDDISQVVEERLLRKTQAARQELERAFAQRSGPLTDVGTLADARRKYPVPTSEPFALFYPFLPWTVAVIPDVVKGIAQAAGREEALTGSNRTMIGVVQGGILDLPGLLDSPVGRLVSLADLYEQFATDAPTETRTDLNRIAETVPGATSATSQVARALYLLGEAEHIPAGLDNVTRSLMDHMDLTLPARRDEVRSELERLVHAGYAKQVGEHYFFLTTQQRGFQDRVRARRDELLAQPYQLGQMLKEFDSDDALRFDRVPLLGQEKPLKLVIDERTVRTPASPVAIKVVSPFQRSLDPQIGDDAAMKQRSAQDRQNIHVRLGEVPELRRALAMYVATLEVADQVLSAPQSSEPDRDVARSAKAEDMTSHRDDVRRMLGQSVRGATVFFNGSAYQLAAGDSAADAMRATLGQILPSIYARYSDVPHRVLNEETAVKAALAGNVTNSDLQQLAVYQSDGTLNEAHPLVSTLRGRLPADDQYQAPVQADTLRSELAGPPFGWDPNVVKVGLALLLRASACRLLDASRPITDPTDPEAFQVLAKEQRFRGLRVQGVPADLSIVDLQQIRGYMETLFDIKPELVAATMNNQLGTQLGRLSERTGTVRQWANTAQCPLPPAFESAASQVEDLLNTAGANARLKQFASAWQPINDLVVQLESLEAFRRDQAAKYQELRDFFTSMVNAESDLPEVRSFIMDWRAVMEERTVWKPERWNEVCQAYERARQAVTQQIAAWRDEAERQIADLDGSPADRLRAVAVPDDQLAAELAALDGFLAPVRSRLERTELSYAEARALAGNVEAARGQVARRIAELQAKYDPNAPVYLKWSQVAGRVELRTSEDVEALVERLRAELGARVGTGVVVVE